LKKLILMTVALLLLAGSSYGLSVRGFVVDGASGEPLPVANVVVDGFQKGSSTNLDGYFHIPGIQPGDYTLLVSYLGYNQIEYEVTVTDDVMDPLRIELSQQSVQLQTVTFKAKKNSSEEIRQSARVSTVPIDGTTIRQMPSLGAEMDVLRAMQSIPGVKASSEISSQLFVRGGSSDMTLIQMDQSTVYNPSHLFGLFSTFNADAVKHVNLMKGAFPAEYGQRAGSVLEVITNDGNREKTEGVVNIGIISAKAALEGPLPGKIGSYAISGRRTYFDILLDQMRKQDSFSDLPDYYFYDANGKINLDLTKRTTLTVGGYLGLDELTSEFGADDNRSDMRVYWGNQTFTSRFRQVVGNSSFFTAGYAYTRYRSGFEFNNQSTLLYKFRDRFYDSSFRGDLEIYSFENHKIKTGYEAKKYTVDVTSGDEDVTFYTIDTNSWNHAFYIQDNWKIGANFEIMPGVRSTYHAKSHENEIDPRLAILYHYDTRTRFKLAGGKYTQYVDVMTSDFELASSFDVWTPNDGTVKPTYTNQLVFGFEHDPRSDLEFTFEAYYNDLNRIHVVAPNLDRAETAKGAFLIGEGYAYGAEFMLRKKAGRLTGWLGYSVSWSKRKFPITEESVGINKGLSYYPKWDRRHDFVAIANYNLNHRWDMSTSWRYNTGQGYTNVNGVFTQHYGLAPNENTDNRNREIVPGLKNNYRFPADHRLDVTFTYKHKFFGLPAKLNFSVYNVYNHRSIWVQQINKGENPIEITKVRLLPILPLIGWEVRF
jgi:CarboxypepD_reg-like domain/TonB dependent receptor-like, beta-barrel/TonB-dependent Receptor Plug Domain